MADDTKDLDFDELHQAVNALMDKAQKGGKPKSEPTKTKDEPAKTDEPTDTAVAVNNDEPEPPSQPAKPLALGDDNNDDNKVAVNVKRTLPTITTHNASHGRAMDVVGPRDKSPALAPPSSNTKRQGMTLQPTQDVKPEPIAPVKPAPQIVKPDQDLLKDDSEDSNDLNEALARLDMQATAKPISGPTMTHQKNEWPDPLDLHLEEEPKVENDEPEKPVVEEKPAADAEQPAPEDSESPIVDTEANKEEAPTVEPSDSEPKADEPEKPEPEPEEPASSGPFVTTKVEKRPLGAYSDTAPAEPEPAPIQTDDLAEKSEPEGKSTEASDQDADKPAETETPTTEPNPTTGQETPKDMGNPLFMQSQPEELSPAVIAVESAEPEYTPANAPEPEASEPTDLRTMAIPQQHGGGESEDASADSQRPVFDTKEYHPAIEAHASPRHSSVGAWVMALILLGLLVGVLGAAYYFITGGLDFSALLP